MWDDPRALSRLADALYAVVVAALVVTAALWVSRLPVFAVREVRVVEPTAHVSGEQIAEVDVRFRVLGRMHELAPSVQDDLRETIASTSGNTGLIFNIALSYGGRGEIVDAVRALLRDGVPAEAVDEGAIARRLYTSDLPDPDLLIRTSGEMRVSNFLLWQIAYAELWVTPVLWPDFRRRHLLEALEDYQRRERRFGGVDPATGQPSPALARR